MRNNDARARRQLELIAEYRRTGSEPAFLELLRSIDGLIGMLINRYAGAGVATEELSAEANVGVMLALRDYNPERGPFSAAAATCVNRVLHDCVHRLGRSTSRTTSKQERKLQIHGGRLYRECLDLGIPAAVAVDLISESMGYDPRHVIDAMNLQRGGDWSIDDGERDEELPGSDPDPDEIVFAGDRTRVLDELLSDLPAEHAEVIRRCHLVDPGDLLKRRQIAASLGMTTFSMRRREIAAFDALKAGVARRGLKLADIV